MATYRGFTTTNYGKCNFIPASVPVDRAGGAITNFSIVDIDLVNRDLLNHIYTRKGERVMMPNFGTIIPELVFEPLDDSTISLVEEELVAVFNYDPRVNLLNISAVPNYDTNTLNISVILQYIELNIQQGFNLNIEFQ